MKTIILEMKPVIRGPKLTVKTESDGASALISLAGIN